MTNRQRGIFQKWFDAHLEEDFTIDNIKERIRIALAFIQEGSLAL